MDDDYQNRRSENSNQEDDEEGMTTECQLDIVFDLSSMQNALKLLEKADRNSIKLLKLYLRSHTWSNLEKLRNALRQIVESLPAMERVYIGLHHFGPRAILHVQDLKTLLDLFVQCDRKIVSLRLNFIQLVGKREDYCGLGICFSALKSLERVNLDKIAVHVSSSGLEPNQPCPLNPVIHSMACLPNLKHLRVLGAHDFLISEESDETHNNVRDEVLNNVVVLRQSTLDLLCRSTRLISLCLIHFNLSDQNMTKMAQELENNQSLKELDVDCTLGKASSCALKRLMECNPVLEELNLCVRSKADEIDFETLSNDQKEKILASQDEINQRLAQGVGKSSLVNFALFRGRLSPKSQDYFRSMMSTQYTLRSLTLYTADEALNKSLSDDPTICFNCKLNSFGRRQILLGELPAKKKDTTDITQSPEGFLLDILGQVSNDLSCLYYFLNANPSICDRVTQKIQGETICGTKRRRSSKTTASSHPSRRTRLYRSAKYGGVCYKV